MSAPNDCNDVATIQSRACVTGPGNGRLFRFAYSHSEPLTPLALSFGRPVVGTGPDALTERVAIPRSSFVGQQSRRAGMSRADVINQRESQNGVATQGGGRELRFQIGLEAQSE